MSSTTAAAVDVKLWKELEQAVLSRDYDAIVKHADKGFSRFRHAKKKTTATNRCCRAVLSAAPGDADALACKVKALVLQSKFAETLALLRAPELRQKFAFEAAYCLYRTNALADAQTLADAIQAPTPHATSLRAQIAFARGDYARCCSIYEALLAAKPVGIDVDELNTNLLAAYVAAGQRGASAGKQFIEANEVATGCCAWTPASWRALALAALAIELVGVPLQRGVRRNRQRELCARRRSARRH